MQNSEIKNQTAITVKDVTVVYKSGLKALDDVSFELNHGKIYGLVGANGSGKSTLFKTIMGFLKPLVGSVKINDMEASKALKHNLISYVPQSEDVDWNFPVRVNDVVMMGRYNHMGMMRIIRNEDKLKVKEALAKVDMLDYRRHQIGELSGGQKKRVFLARAIAQGAKIILLDEPFSGVDIKTEAKITELISELRDSGHLILISTHNLGSVPDFCDEVLLINRKILAKGPVETTFTEENLAKVFGGMFRHFQLEPGVIHSDSDTRSISVITDDERPLVLYGKPKSQTIVTSKNEG
jgi:manganese/iron transport system ATP-binding protein